MKKFIICLIFALGITMGNSLVFADDDDISICADLDYPGSDGGTVKTRTSTDNYNGGIIYITFHSQVCDHGSYIHVKQQYYTGTMLPSSTSYEVVGKQHRLNYEGMIDNWGYVRTYIGISY